MKRFCMKSGFGLKSVVMFLLVAISGVSAQTDINCDYIQEGPGRVACWRNRVFEADRSLAGAYLVAANLSRLDLRGKQLSAANLTGADLSGANLSGSQMSRAILRNANLSSADLINTDLSGADLTGAILTGAVISAGTRGVDQQSWRDRGGKIFGVEDPRAACDRIPKPPTKNSGNLTSNSKSRCFEALAKSGYKNLARADLRGADLRGVNLDGADLTEADLSFHTYSVQGIQSVRPQVKWRTFWHNGWWQIVIDTSLIDASLIGAKLVGANLTSTWVAGTNFTRADLSNARLSVSQGLGDKRYYDLYPIFAHTNLSNVDLTYSVGLTCIDLRTSNLSGMTAKDIYLNSPEHVADAQAWRNRGGRFASEATEAGIANTCRLPGLSSGLNNCSPPGSRTGYTWDTATCGWVMNPSAEPVKLREPQMVNPRYYRDEETVLRSRNPVHYDVPFTWGTVPAAAGYTVEVEKYRDADGTWISIGSQTTSAGAVAVTIRVPLGDRLRWRVRAIGPGNVIGHGSWVQFSVKFNPF